MLAEHAPIRTEQQRRAVESADGPLDHAHHEVHSVLLGGSGGHFSLGAGDVKGAFEIQPPGDPPASA
jgi:hypothetical protein